MGNKRGFFARLGVGVFWDIVLFVVVITVATLFGLSSLGSAYGLTVGVLLLFGLAFYLYRRRASPKRATSVETGAASVKSASGEN